MGLRRPARRAGAIFRRDFNGRSETKNLALAPRHAPFGRRAEAADLCRGQGFGRIAPPAPCRPEDRHVSRPAGAQGEDRSLTLSFALKLPRSGTTPGRDIFALLAR